MVVFMLVNATGIGWAVWVGGVYICVGLGRGMHTTFVFQNTHCCCVSQLCLRQ